jgi:hypothetical protein
LKAVQGLPVRQVLLKEKRVKDRKRKKLKKQVKRDRSWRTNREVSVQRAYSNLLGSGLVL